MLKHDAISLKVPTPTDKVDPKQSLHRAVRKRLAKAKVHLVKRHERKHSKAGEQIKRPP